MEVDTIVLENHKLMKSEGIDLDTFPHIAELHHSKLLDYIGLNFSEYGNIGIINAMEYLEQFTL